MLFYGPAGTGKTELSRFIGHEVNMKVKVVRASDILDMYVGQSERILLSSSMNLISKMRS